MKHLNNGNIDSTAQLVKTFCDGDDSAFSRLYDLYIHILFNYGSRLTNDSEMLKDCIHDVFTKLYTKRASLGSIENFRSYLFISLKNRLVDEMRRSAFSSDTEVELLNPVADDDVERNYLNREKELFQSVKIAHLLDQLSSRQREAIKLYYIDGLNYDEICKKMNMNYQLEI